MSDHKKPAARRQSPSTDEIVRTALAVALHVAVDVGFHAGCDHLATTLKGQEVPRPVADKAAEDFGFIAGAEDCEMDEAARIAVAVDAVESAYGYLERVLDLTISSARKTDAGNAIRLVRLHGLDLRHATGLGWLQWDGRRWDRDEDDKQVMRLAIATAAAIFRAGAELRADDGGGLAKWGMTSESVARLRAMIDVAKSIQSIAVDVDQLDGDALALNVNNGTVDLQTGQLRPHERTDLITKLAPVTFDPEAQCPRWDQFLREILPDEQLRQYVQRAIGYSLTGDTSEQVLFLAHGPGANGKSTLLEVIAAAIGDYAGAASAASFTTASSGRSVRSDLATLRGARFVRAAEIDRDAHLAESLVKQLTGGEKIVVAFKHQNEFEFQPELKLWLSVNDLPRITSEGPAIWRRIRVVPFETHIIDPDRGLPAALRLEHSGILAWAIRGAVEWHARGLGGCPAVADATGAYRGEQDRVSQFIDACCEIGAAEREPSGVLANAYAAWEQELGRRPMDDFHGRLDRLGYPARKSNGTRYRLGLRLTEEATGSPRVGQNGTSHEESLGEFGNGRPCPTLGAVEGGSL